MVAICLAGSDVEKLRLEIERDPAAATRLLTDEKLLLATIQNSSDTDVPNFANVLMEKEERSSPGKTSYELTQKLLDVMQEAGTQRPLLNALTLSLKGDVLQRQGKTEEAAKIFGIAMEKQADVRFLMEYHLMKTAQGRAKCLLKIGDKKGAEAMFVEVTRYNWYLTRDNDMADKQRAIYIDAVHELIRLRKGDKAALARIRIHPLMTLLFQQELEEAMKAP